MAMRREIINTVMAFSAWPSVCWFAAAPSHSGVEFVLPAVLETSSIGS
jgi:hypothetical protein